MASLVSSRPQLNILLVGSGKMGTALLLRWLERNLVARCVVVDPIASLALNPAILKVNEPGQIPSDFKPNVIIYAVKPQGMEAIVPAYAKYTDALVLSIAAGKQMGFFENILGRDSKIVRAMPNTPAQIGEGITVAVANRNVSLIEKDWAQQLLSAVGDVIWVGDEKLMNAVTALSGSGPAYLFLLIEILSHAGAQIGLSPDMAEKLARKTVTGSAALAAANPSVSAQQLRQNVTSPGGTTEAALEVLTKGGMLEKLFTAALLAATKRAEELSK